MPESETVPVVSFLNVRPADHGGIAPSAVNVHRLPTSSSCRNGPVPRVRRRGAFRGPAVDGVLNERGFQMNVLVSCLVFVGLPLLGLLLPGEVVSFREWKREKRLVEMRREQAKHEVWVKMRIEKGKSIV